MGKHILILLLVSIISIIWIKEIAQVLHYMMHLYIVFSKTLSRFIVGGYLIAVVRQSIVLMMVPLLITMVPVGLYWLIKRRLMPHAHEILYIAWFIMLTTLVLYKQIKF